MFLTEEAQHWVINEQQGKNSELVLAAYSKLTGKKKSENKKKSDKECGNCKRKGHVDQDCYAKGGGKEGQAPWQNKGKQKETAAIATTEDAKDELFAFTCTSDFVDIAAISPHSKTMLGTCVDSGASNNYSPDQNKFSNYKEINRDITTANGRIIKAIGTGDLHLDLPNGSKMTKVIFKNAVHSAFYQ